MIEDLLYSRLSGWAGLAALVGNRIEPVVLPIGGKPPAVTYRLVKTGREILDGADPGITRTNFEVFAWAETYAAARAVAQQVRLALERWQDDTNGVQDTYILDEYEDFDADAQVYGRAVLAKVVHNEEVS